MDELEKELGKLRRALVRVALNSEEASNVIRLDGSPAEAYAELEGPGRTKVLREDLSGKPEGRSADTGNGTKKISKTEDEERRPRHAGQGRSEDTSVVPADREQERQPYRSERKDGESSKTPRELWGLLLLLLVLIALGVWIL